MTTESPMLQKRSCCPRKNVLVRFESLQWDTRETAQRTIVTQNNPSLQASGLAPIDSGSRLGFQPAEALRADDFAP